MTMLPIDESSQVGIQPGQPRGYALQSQEWVGQGISVRFENGTVSDCTNQRSVGVTGKYGVLTVGPQGGYSYALHEGIAAGRDSFVYVGEEPCVYLMEPLWLATEVFNISSSPSGSTESHQVVVSIAVR